MQQHRSVERGDHRHLDVEDVHQNFLSLAPDLVVAHRRKEVEALTVDRVHERITGSGQNDDSVFAVLTDPAEQIDELFVSVAVEDQLSAVGVQSDLQHSRLIAAEPRIRESITVGLESCTHANTPLLKRHFRDTQTNMTAADDDRDLLSRSLIAAITRATNRPRISPRALRRADFRDLSDTESRLLDFQQHYEQIATPFEWKFTKNDLNALLERIAAHDNADPALAA